LQKDDKLLEKAREIFSALSKTKSVYFSVSNSIGKRYAKADEIGINSSITVDFQTIDDGTVTVRDIRDTSQVRKSISELLK
jgi:glycyl-tRNA synthetase